MTPDLKSKYKKKTSRKPVSNSVVPNHALGTTAPGTATAPQAILRCSQKNLKSPICYVKK